MSDFNVGDQVKVYFKSGNVLRKSTKSKTQVFSGIVLGSRGEGISKTFRVLKDATARVKVERIFPLESPLLEKVEVIKKARKVRRAKLYYLRNRARSQI